jgi:adenosine 3'-phospho 5'-phosphosulfate transporter B3
MRKYSVFLLGAGFFLGMVLMELLLEYVTASFQHKFASQSSLPASVTLSQFAACFVLPILVKPEAARSISLSPRSPAVARYAALAVLIFGATGLATASLAYVAYPVKIVFKSTKLIPTMLVSYLFSGQTYSALDYAAAACLCLGTASFVYHPPSSPGAGAGTSWVGILLLLCSVLCDAFVPNVQKSIMNYVGAEELMTNSNLLGLIGVFLYMLFHGDLADLLRVISTDEQRIVLSASLIGVGLALAVSVLCYTRLIQEAGAVPAVALATTRKVASIVCTYVVFPKPLSALELAALGMIVAGISVEVLKAKLKGDPHTQSSVEKQ